MRNQHERRSITWLVVIVFLAIVIAAIGAIVQAEKAEDERWCDFIEQRVENGTGFTKEEIDILYRRYNCIDDKYSMPYRSDRFLKLYEKHIKPL